MTQQNKEYNDFCKADDLQPQYDRIKVADFGREQTRCSNAGAKRYQSSNTESIKENLEKNNTYDTIKLSEQEQHALNKYMSSESYVLNDKLRRGKLSANEQKHVKNLDSALDKMPEYKGTVYRSVSDFGIEIWMRLSSTYEILIKTNKKFIANIEKRKIFPMLNK